jgi:hypothetical protein
MSGIDRKVNLTNGGSVTVNVTENPRLGDTEEWAMSNFTADAHPIHLHLVRFQVVKRECITTPDVGCVTPNVIQPWELGYKDTVIAYPGEITTVRVKFDMEGLYVWHCHIVEHEDNEMMRPYVVSADAPAPINKVTGFRLYNADSNLVILDPLISGAMLDIAGMNVNFEAVTASPDNGTESVILELFGPTSTSRSERLAPYMLAGDNGAGDIFPMTLVPGVYTLKATPYTQDFGGGTAGTPVEIYFTVKGIVNNNVVSEFRLYRASNDADLGVLSAGRVVNLSAECDGSVAGCNIRAVVPSPDSAVTDRVRLSLGSTNISSGAPFRDEGTAPYFLGGDVLAPPDVLPLPIGAPYIGAGLTEGSHTVHAVPVAPGGALGPEASVTFSVVP